MYIYLLAKSGISVLFISSKINTLMVTIKNSLPFLTLVEDITKQIKFHLRELEYVMNKTSN